MLACKLFYAIHIYFRVISFLWNSLLSSILISTVYLFNWLLLLLSLFIFDEDSGGTVTSFYYFFISLCVSIIFGLPLISYFSISASSVGSILHVLSLEVLNGGLAFYAISGIRRAQEEISF